MERTTAKVDMINKIHSDVPSSYNTCVYQTGHVNFQHIPHLVHSPPTISGGLLRLEISKKVQT